MTISYEKFMKHSDVMVRDKNLTAFQTHPIIQGVKHFEDGSAAVTDSHRLYLVKNIHNRTDGAVLTPKGKKLDGKFPDIHRLLPDTSYANEKVSLSVKDLLQAAITIRDIAKVVEDAERMDLVNGRIQFNSIHIQFKYQLEQMFNFDFRICLNAGYVADAMKLFQDAGDEEVQVLFYGSLRPLLFQTDQITTLILPIRKG